MRCMRTPLDVTRSSFLRISAGVSARSVEHAGRREDRGQRIAKVVTQDAQEGLPEVVVPAALVDVRVRPEPANDAAVGVVERLDARQEPAKHAVGAAQRELHLERLAGLDRVLPPLERRRRASSDRGAIVHPQPCMSSNVVPVYSYQRRL